MRITDIVIQITKLCGYKITKILRSSLIKLKNFIIASQYHKNTMEKI